MFGYLTCYLILIISILVIITLVLIIPIGMDFDTEENFSNDDLLVWGWAINKDRKKMEHVSRFFTKSAKHFGIEPKLIGIGVDYAPWDAPVVDGDGSKAGHGLQRFYVLRDELKNVPDEQIILVMDTADTVIAGSAEEILRRFKKLNTRFLISAEAGFTYQYPRYKKKYDENNPHNKYKYIAAGTFIGYAKELKKMVEECIVLCCVDKDSGAWNTVEMNVLSHWVHKYLIPKESKDKQSFVRLDTDCELFWVTTSDDRENDSFSRNLDLVTSSPNFTDKSGSQVPEDKFYNPLTDTYPIVLHLVGRVKKKQEESVNKVAGHD